MTQEEKDDWQKILKYKWSITSMPNANIFVALIVPTDVMFWLLFFEVLYIPIFLSISKFVQFKINY